MMYFLGWLSFFQITFFPGSLLVYLLKIRTESLFQKLIFVFGLSLVANFIITFLLALFHLYRPATVYMIFASELFLLFLTIRKKKICLQLSLSKTKNIYLLILVLAACFLFLRFLLPLVQNLSLRSVFLTGDVLDSWNPWARQWAANQIPLPTFHYPQLITANWSLSYLFMQSTQVELFAKLLMPLFSLVILLIFFDLKNLVGLIITGVLLHYYFDNSFLRDGYVDIAFAFFSFLSFYLWLLYQKYRRKEYIFLLFIFALGSFLTKQLGIYIVFLSLIQVACSMNKTTIKKYLPLTVFTGLVFAFTCLWWLLKIKESAMASNIETIYHSATNQTFANKPLSARFWHDFVLLAPNLKGIIVCTAILLLQIRALFNKKTLKVILFIILPFFIFWSLFLNYDQRNLAVIFPFLGYTGSVSLNPVSVKYLTETKKIEFSCIKLFFIMVGCLLVLSFFVPDSKLIARQLEGKKQIGIPELNSNLYKYYYKNGLQGKIATNYYRLCNLPEIGQYCLYGQKLNRVPTKAKYLLYPQDIFEPAKNCLKKIFIVNGWIFCSR